ncbi:MAG TPA: hypothetical protein VK181_00630 [Rhizobium sp.]|nr:hypothetical protein [Rhizobium sp.]
MPSARISTFFNPTIGVFAVLFGVATLISGGNNILFLQSDAEPTERIVPFVLYFNFAAGFAYVAAGAAFILHRRWASTLAIAIATATLLVFTGLGVWILMGYPYELKTVIAMTIRTVFWWFTAIASQLLNNARPAPPRSLEQ